MALAEDFIQPSVQQTLTLAGEVAQRASRAAARATAAAFAASSDPLSGSIQSAEACTEVDCVAPNASRGLNGDDDAADDEPQLPITRAPLLTARLGQGSFGTVWSAHDEHGRAVAVKVVPMPDDNAISYELGREITLMRQFCHRNVVQFYTAFRSAELPEVWVVMQLCERGSLQDIVRRTGTLDGAMCGAVCHEVL
tara:strand:- start:396 stop:983 length:588 start_codon:yes stop_codon:yes gene_type:complete